MSQPALSGHRSGLVDRHLAFLEALRGAGLSVSLAEGLDAIAGLRVVGWGERVVVRETYAATLVKRQAQRSTFDTLFDLYFPALVGGGVAADEPVEEPEGEEAEATPRVQDNAAALSEFLQRFSEADRLVAQPYTPGPNILMQGARARDGRIMRHGVFLADYKFGGVTQRLRPWSVPEAVHASCEAFVAQAGITGAYHFDLLYDQKSDTPYFLEINGRLGGTTNKVRCCGYEQPIYMLACYGGAEWRDSPPPPKEKRVSNRFSILRRLNDLRHSEPDLLDFPTGPRPQLIRDLAVGLLAWTDENLSARHWRTTVDYHRQMLADQAGRS